MFKLIAEKRYSELDKIINYVYSMCFFFHALISMGRAWSVTLWCVCSASKTAFLLATVTLSPAPSPAPRILNKVSYFHKERWQPQAVKGPVIL